jgi:primosomal protein N' (replication factor Y)
MMGFGTEKVEEELQIIFPDAVFARMDLDTTRNKNSYYSIISDFEEGKTDILVGTQMVTKGLDFDNVGLVGVLNADSMINYPDFRSFERSYQMLAQVSGRAGRKKKRGKVVIQSRKPYHAVLRYVMENRFNDMLQSQLQERQRFHYPPFFRLILITVRHKDQEITQAAAYEFGQMLRTRLGDRLLGPEYPLVGRVRNQYRMQLMVKMEQGISFKAVKKYILECTDNFKLNSENKAAQIIFEVDPL